MRTAYLRRFESDDFGTFGIFSTESFSCYTAELPWRDNKTDISCIPEGTYRVVWGLSPKHGPTFCLIGVPGRDNIQIHSGNWAGDVNKGLKSSVLGCICVGSSIGEIGEQKAVMRSRDTLMRLEDDLERKPFNLVITRKS